jgi:plastocyanin
MAVAAPSDNPGVGRALPRVTHPAFALTPLEDARVKVVLGLLLLGSLAAAPARAGIIRGTLWMTPIATAASASKPQAAPDLRAQRGVADAVIYLDAVPAKVERQLANKAANKRTWFVASRPEPRPSRIVQIDRQFRPRVAAVPVGARVEVQNLDRVYHNTFSVSPAKRFDLGKYPPGQTDTVSFDRPGVVNLHCDIHPDMLGFIVVTPNHAFTRPDSLGRYRLPKLPPGDYTVRVFHPRRGEIKRRIVMPKRGDLDLDLAF